MIMKMKRYSKFIIYTALCAGLISCKEDKLELYDDSVSSLNFAKTLTDPSGTVLEIFGDEEDYPESYSFNAHFLGSDANNRTFEIPVRLTGKIDEEHDREYRIRVNPEKSNLAVKDVHYSLDENQIFHKGLFEDHVLLTIHTDAMDETSSYKLHIELVPNENFTVGMSEYQYIEVNFTKNLVDPPAFWLNNNKLNKLTYHPRKCAVFLEISGITDPDWRDNGATIQIDYWISLATQWFLNHEEYDENGNRIYFDE